jgi:phage N-6-adenine-methyltransferase
MTALLGPPQLSLALPDVPATLAKDERHTPSSLFDPLYAEFRFTIDVATTPAAAKVKRFFTREDNGLAKSWAGERVWCNPPFSCIPLWLEKAWREVLSGACPFIFMLLPADRTDQRWWGTYVEPWRDKRLSTDWALTSRFLPGRIHFGTPEDPHALRRSRPKAGVVGLIWEATCRP